MGKTEFYPIGRNSCNYQVSVSHYGSLHKRHKINWSD